MLGPVIATTRGRGVLTPMAEGRSGVSAYVSKVLGYNPIAYWILGEAAGATAIDEVDSPNQDGAYTGVVLGQPGIGDGNTCPLFVGIAPTFVDIYTATLSPRLDGSEGTIHLWFKVFNAGVWTDGASRYCVSIRGAPGTNFIQLRKSNINNRIISRYTAGGVNKLRNTGGMVTTDWVPYGMTWSAIADQWITYVNGTPNGPVVGALGVWNGVALDNNETAISTTFTVDGRFPFNGYLAHCAIWDTPLTEPQMATLAVV